VKPCRTKEMLLLVVVMLCFYASPAAKGQQKFENTTNRSWWIRSYPAYDHSGTR